jgi:hypothetical protein
MVVAMSDTLAEQLAKLPVAQALFGACIALGQSGQSSKMQCAALSSVARGAVQGMASSQVSQRGDGKSVVDPVHENTAFRPVDDMEELLRMFTPRLDRKVNVKDAKSYIRDHGDPKLASRVGRLSKGRNVQAHPDVGLLDDVASFLSTSGDSDDRVTDNKSVEASTIHGATPDRFYMGEELIDGHTQTDMHLSVPQSISLPNVAFQDDGGEEEGWHHLEPLLDTNTDNKKRDKQCSLEKTSKFTWIPKPYIQSGLKFAQLRTALSLVPKWHDCDHIRSEIAKAMALQKTAMRCKG